MIWGGDDWEAYKGPIGPVGRTNVFVLQRFVPEDDCYLEIPHQVVHLFRTMELQELCSLCTLDIDDCAFCEGGKINLD